MEEPHFLCVQGYIDKVNRQEHLVPRRRCKSLCGFLLLLGKKSSLFCSVCFSQTLLAAFPNFDGLINTSCDYIWSSLVKVCNRGERERERGDKHKWKKERHSINKKTDIRHKSRTKWFFFCQQDILQYLRFGNHESKTQNDYIGSEELHKN